MSDILLVEDSRFFASLVLRRFAREPEFTVHWAESFAEARSKIETERLDCFLALLDLNLPDSPRGEIVDWFTRRGTPSIVFTGGFDEEVRRAVLSKHVVDYVLKENEDSLETLVRTVRRIHKNQSVKVLVADDSATARSYLSNLLGMHLYQVIEARDGDDALRMLAEHPDVTLVITDYNMPGKDGFQLVKEVRKTRSKEQLAIIGMSASGNNTLSARFIKAGANDFVNKPFLTEEFHCRVAQNVELMEYIALIRALSETDSLTGLANRRHFFERGQAALAKAAAEGAPVAFGLVDIDHFKRVNDSYGHSAGDEVLRWLASELGSRFAGGAVVGRLGGEEFGVLMIGERAVKAGGHLEVLRAAMENAIVEVDHFKIRCTVSAGVQVGALESLDAMIARADDLLYEAKNGGRNRVIIGAD
jgi:diguanylate cyclase (GGDEF)-like protein